MTINTIPQNIVRMIEARALALHYAVMADLLKEDGSLSREQLERFARDTSRRFESIHDMFMEKNNG